MANDSEWRKMNVVDVRMTLYALISGLERDLRDGFIKYVMPSVASDKVFKDEIVKKKCESRYLKDNPGFKKQAPAIELIEYLDYPEIITLIMQWKKYVNPNMLADIKDRYDTIELSIGVRNRVMHVRPLDAGDFSLVYGLIVDLLQMGKHRWLTCGHTYKKLNDDPGYVLNLILPDYRDAEGQVFHNLPVPDFDDTGFIGRTEDVQDLEKLILGPNRVISVIGEGGVGKTALIQKVAYKIMDMGEQCPFDAIIWVSCKTQILTNSGVTEIKNAIDNYIGVVENITNAIGTEGVESKNTIEEIIEFTEIFNVLIILDNLETVYNENVMQFIRKVQETAKIAITSRIGLGELELRRPLLGMRDSEAIRLLREHSIIRNVTLLRKAQKRQLQNTVVKLYNNPLFIKWFVQAVSAGKSPNEVLANKDDMLEYCMSNVYDKLSDETVKLLNTILIARGKISEPEMIYYTEMEPYQYRKHINKLISTSLLERESATSGTCIDCQYSVNPLARHYLLANRKPTKEFIAKQLKKKRQLEGMYSESLSIGNTDEFSVTSIEISSKGEKVAGRFLSKALKVSKRRKYEEATELIEQAKKILPGYYEVYKVSGFINARKEMYIDAEEDYRVALELAPDNLRVHFFYGGFLLRYFDDAGGALKHLGKAYQGNKESSTVAIEYARCLGYTGAIEEALQILLKLNANQERLTMKHNMLTTTLIMNFYKRLAESKYRIGKDLKGSIASLRKSLEMYDTTTARKDNKIMEALEETLKEYENIARWSDDTEEKDRYKSIQQKYINEIRYGDLLEADDGNESIELKSASGRKIGHVINVNQAGGYGFIQSKSGSRFYFNKHQVRRVGEWTRLEHGTSVEYEIGENSIGKCAIKLVVKE